MLWDLKYLVHGPLLDQLQINDHEPTYKIVNYLVLRHCVALILWIVQCNLTLLKQTNHK